MTDTKHLSEKESFYFDEDNLKRLQNLKEAYQTLIQENFEFNAKPCLTCDTQGICCLDAHFVNVHITQLEALAIIKTLLELKKLEEVSVRTEKAIKDFCLSENNDTFRQTFSCPLFEKENGCLVHQKAKPLPCITHACYEKKEDLPPEFLQSRAEKQVEELNGDVCRWLPLPIALKKSLEIIEKFESIDIKSSNNE